MLTYSIIFLLLFAIAAQGQEVLKSEAGDAPGKGSLSELNWLTGYWKGTGLGGECDELWMPAADNCMTGIFRLMKEGKLSFSEYMILEEAESTVTLKLKHFGRDLTPWEEKDKWIIFNLIKIEDMTAYFNGITYHRNGDELLIKLILKSKDKEWTEEFRFTKENLN